MSLRDLRMVSLPVFALMATGMAATLPVAAKAQAPEEQLAAASALFDAKKYDQAAQTLDAFLAKTPKHPKAGLAAFVLGRCRTELKQYPAAIAAYSKAIATKDATVATESELGLAEAAMQTTKYDLAASALQEAVKGTLKPEQAAVAYYWLGESDYNLKRYREAREAYDKVANDYSKSELAPNALYGAALASVQDNQLDLAKQRFRSLIDRYRNSHDRPQAMVTLGQIEVNTKSYGEARRDFEAALNEGAVRTNATLRANAEDGLIQCLLEQKEYGKAAPLLEVAVARLALDDPQRYRAALELGNCRYQTKEYDRAVGAYQTAAEAKEENIAVQGLYWQGNAQLGQMRYADAASTFTKLVTKYPKDKLASKAQLKSADALAQAKQLKEASAAYQLLLEKYPTSPEAATARQNLAALVGGLDDPVQILAAVKNAPPAEKNPSLLRVARIYLAAKKIPEATAVLNDTLKNSPTPEVGGEAHYLTALIYDSQKKPAPAAAALAQATTLSPKATWALDANTRLAELYVELKQPDKAEKAANAALDLKPDEMAAQQIRLTLVQAQLDQKRWDDAFTTCQALLTHNPTRENAASALYTQAWVREQQKKSDEALPLWEKLANDFPKSDGTAEALLHVGDARMKAEKYPEAQERYTALITNFPMSEFIAEARFKRGSALYNAGKAEEAAADFQAVADDKTAKSYQPEALYWSGVALDKAGKKMEAVQRLTALVTQYPTHTRVTNAKIRLAALKATLGQ